MSDVRRFRLDDLRSFATALAASLGVSPVRASSLASHMLWFDEAGLGPHGIVRLPELLERIESQAIDPKTEGSVGLERNGTAVFDARHGIPLLALSRAGGIATEKARDAGVGLVTVRNLASAGSVAGIAAEMAIGPTVGIVLGPDSSSTIAMPGSQGLPAVFDSALGSEDDRAELLSQVAPWASVLAPKDGWLVLAIAVAAIEPLTAFQERVATAIEGLVETPARLIPALWEKRRHEARERGIVITPKGWKPLQKWADRLGIEIPKPAVS